jgi:hypothetical protein
MPAAQSDLFRLDRKLKSRPTLVQGLERAPVLQPRKLITETEMDARAEGHVLVRLAFEIERAGQYVCRRIQVGRHQHCHDLIAVLQPEMRAIELTAKAFPVSIPTTGVPDDFILTGTLGQGAERLCRMVPPVTEALANSIYKRVLRPFTEKNKEKG